MDGIDEFHYYEQMGIHGAKSVVFNVERCQNITNNTDCASEDQIDDFLHDMTIDYWTIEKNLKMNTKEQPVYRNMRILN